MTVQMNFGEEKMTKTEEYKKKLSELRNQRDDYYAKVHALEKEMDALEGDIKLAEFTVGKFIKVDRTSKGGYVEYFHVDKWVKDPRGVKLYGKGYSDSPGKVATYIHIVDNLRLTWDELNLPEEITEIEFINKFNSIIAEMNRSLLDFTDYKQLEDEFAFKNAMFTEKFKEVSLDDNTPKRYKLVDYYGNPIKIDPSNLII